MRDQMVLTAMRSILTLLIGEVQRLSAAAAAAAAAAVAAAAVVAAAAAAAAAS